MKSKQWKKIGIILLFLAVAAFALSGCSGSDGSPGATGATGPQGPQGPQGPAGPGAITDASTMSVEEVGTALQSSTVTLDSITIASAPVVKFTIKDSKGNGIAGLRKYTTAAVPSLEYVKFNIAKLVPGVNGSPSKWVNYIVTTAVAPPASPAYLYPAYDSQGTLVDNGGGSYTYTFYRDLAKIKDTRYAEDVTYDPTATHRLVVVVTPPEPDPPTKFFRCVNAVFDFTIDPTTKAGIPLTAASERRDITTTARCNSCHTDISKMFMNNADNDGHHFDTRPDVRNCINCHTAQLGLVVKPDGTVVPGATSTNFAFAPPTESNRRYQPRIADGESLFDFTVMIHKLHMGERLAKTGYNFDGVLFNEKVYTQDITNCRKCHAASADTPQGDNWKNKPSRMACGSCHDGINWETGTGKTVSGATTGHVGGRATSDALCIVCHDAVSIDAIYHVTANATPNNPNVPAGAVNFIYEINSVTVNTSLQPVVKFRIKSYTGTNAALATPVTFNNATAATLLTGFTGSPSFLVSYALPQDGLTAPADYNNLGKISAQPASVSIDNVRKGTSGTLAGPDADGYYTATLTQAASGTLQAAAFPAGATLRAVALQGYFTQVTPALARHTPGVVKAVTGDTVRRTVVDSAKCANCHEWFEGHGGNRVYEMQMCLPCHVPNLSSSGRTVRLTDPEGAQNLKDMVHSIHASSLPLPGMRTNPYKHSRAKSGSATVYDWSDVKYPAALKNCETCHKPGTYGSVPAAALMTANVTTGDPAAIYDPATSMVTSTDTTASLTTLRNAGLANATDLVITPYTAACVSCHDGANAKAHMTANGGAINKPRSTVNAAAEQCAICHGAGRSADVNVVHK